MKSNFTFSNFKLRVHTFLPLLSFALYLIRSAALWEIQTRQFNGDQRRTDKEVHLQVTLIITRGTCHFLDRLPIFVKLVSPNLVKLVLKTAIRATAMFRVTWPLWLICQSGTPADTPATRIFIVFQCQNSWTVALYCLNSNVAGNH